MTTSLSSCTLVQLYGPSQALYKYTSLISLFLPPNNRGVRLTGEQREMIKLRTRKLFRNNSKLGVGGGGGGGGVDGCGQGNIQWELRPGGMLVQKREGRRSNGEEVIQLRITTGSQWHDISIGATSTFGELKVLLSLMTGLEPGEQRLLFRGKEREDCDHLHMVGVQERDKVLLLEDPAIKERKQHSMAMAQAIGKSYHTFISA